MPILFSPTIGAAITAGYWFLWVRCPACRTTNAIDFRTLDRHPDAAVTRVSFPLCPVAHAGRTRRSPRLVLLSRTSIADEMRIEHTRGCLASDRRTTAAGGDDCALPNWFLIELASRTSYFIAGREPGLSWARFGLSVLHALSFGRAGRFATTDNSSESCLAERRYSGSAARSSAPKERPSSDQAGQAIKLGSILSN
jgi:hypothetical protein